MKLLCINAGVIEKNGLQCEGKDLEEGKIYETKAKSFIGKSGAENYYIEGVGARLACRFAELLEEKDKASEAIKKLKEEFQLN